MEALPANIGIFYTFGFPLCSFVICAFFRNSALTDIKEVGIKPQFYPRHYIAPALYRPGTLDAKRIWSSSTGYSEI